MLTSALQLLTQNTQVTGTPAPASSRLPYGQSTGTVDFSAVLQQAAQKSSGSMDAVFERAAQDTGLPLNLIKAVAKAESDFNPNCVSSAGAMGVMQLMPENCTEYGVSDPFDAEQNILAGARHLRDMINRFDGDVRLGLAAYNAGPGNVKKYGGIPPFKETQNYVPRVLKYASQDLGSAGVIPLRTSLSSPTSIYDGALGLSGFSSALTGSTNRPGIPSSLTGDLSSLSTYALTANSPASLISSVLSMMNPTDGKTTTEQANAMHDVLRTLIHTQLSSSLFASEEEDPLTGTPDVTQAQAQRIHYLSL